MRNTPITLVAGCCLILISAVSQAASSAKPTYKWVDADGVTHYGDSVPPEYAQGSRSELNDQGVEIRRLPASLSPEAAAAADKAAADESRRRQHDLFLLTTYTSTRDIEQLRDERIALVEGQLTIARSSIESADGKMQAITKRIANFKPYSKAANARRLPDALAEEAVRALQDHRSLSQVIATREQEKQELHKQFDTDLARYRELTANRLPR
jgi:hypothetical protein